MATAGLKLNFGIVTLNIGSADDTDYEERIKNIGKFMCYMVQNCEVAVFNFQEINSEFMPIDIWNEMLYELCGSKWIHSPITNNLVTFWNTDVLFLNEMRCGENMMGTIMDFSSARGCGTKFLIVNMCMPMEEQLKCLQNLFGVINGISRVELDEYVVSISGSFNLEDIEYRDMVREMVNFGAVGAVQNEIGGYVYPDMHGSAYVGNTFVGIMENLINSPFKHDSRDWEKYEVWREGNYEKIVEVFGAEPPLLDWFVLRNCDKSSTFAVTLGNIGEILGEGGEGREKVFSNHIPIVTHITIYPDFELDSDELSE